MPDNLERLLGARLAQDPSRGMPASPGGLLGYRRGRGPGARELAVTEDAQDSISALHDRIGEALADLADMTCPTARQAGQDRVARLRQLLAAQVRALRRLG